MIMSISSKLVVQMLSQRKHQQIFLERKNKLLPLLRFACWWAKKQPVTNRLLIDHCRKCKKIEGLHQIHFLGDLQQSVYTASVGFRLFPWSFAPAWEAWALKA